MSLEKLVCDQENSLSLLTDDENIEFSGGSGLSYAAGWLLGKATAVVGAAYASGCLVINAYMIEGGWKDAGREMI
jgi:hypothetical protein